MTVLEWLQEVEEEERIVKVGCTNGVHNPGTRGMLICQAAELAGRLHAYRESLHYMMRAGMIPADLLDDVKEVLK